MNWWNNLGNNNIFFPSLLIPLNEKKKDKLYIKECVEEEEWMNGKMK